MSDGNQVVSANQQAVYYTRFSFISYGKSE